jgi:hypothetical protein
LTVSGQIVTFDTTGAWLSTDIANLVTGFAVAQVIATTLALANGQIVGLKGPLGHWLAFIFTAIFTALYLIAINWCNANGSRLSPEEPDIWRNVNKGRKIAIAVFTLILFLTIAGH